mmetsp:Transcript_18505/g.31666  ORF Transcript_18505/g.31666 Transcript_18505/m.31666 type:complete len:492 (+) Transcript_18505:3025-4500(+)
MGASEPQARPHLRLPVRRRDDRARLPHPPQLLPRLRRGLRGPSGRGRVLNRACQPGAGQARAGRQVPPPAQPVLPRDPGARGGARHGERGQPPGRGRPGPALPLQVLQVLQAVWRGVRPGHLDQPPHPVRQRLLRAHQLLRPPHHLPRRAGAAHLAEQRHLAGQSARSLQGGDLRVRGLLLRAGQGELGGLLRPRRLLRQRRHLQPRGPHRPQQPVAAARGAPGHPGGLRRRPGPRHLHLGLRAAVLLLQELEEGAARLRNRVPRPPLHLPARHPASGRPARPGPPRPEGLGCLRPQAPPQVQEGPAHALDSAWGRGQPHRDPHPLPQLLQLLHLRRPSLPQEAQGHLSRLPRLPGRAEVPPRRPAGPRAALRGWRSPLTADLPRPNDSGQAPARQAGGQGVDLPRVRLHRPLSDPARARDPPRPAPSLPHPQQRPGEGEGVPPGSGPPAPPGQLQHRPVQPQRRPRLRPLELIGEAEAWQVRAQDREWLI